MSEYLVKEEDGTSRITLEEDTGYLITEEQISLWESVVLDDDPAAFWGLDSVSPTEDDSGNGGTLTAVAAPSEVSSLLSYGEFGGGTGARDFNGSTQAYTAADSAFLDLGDEFTLEFFVSFDSVAGTDTILSKGTGAFQVQRSGTGLLLAKEGTGTILSTTGVTLATSTVYHVVVVKDGSTGAYIYVNGTDRSGTVTDRTCVDTATSLHIGRKSDSSDYLDGKLDEVAVYPYAFTADMVTTHYTVHSAGTFGYRVAGNAVFPSFMVEIAFSSDPRDTYQRWHNVTRYVKQSGGNRGRSFALDRTQTGVWNFRLNNRQRQFDPTYTSSPYYPNVILTKAIRVRAAAPSSRTRYRFRGLIDGFKLNYDQGGFDPTVDIQASGMFKAVSLDKYTGAAPQPEELSGTRLATVLDVDGVTTDLGTGQSLIVATDLDQAGKLDHAQAVVETEGGVLFEAADGTLVFQDRHYRILNEASVRYTFGDGGGTQIPIREISPQLDEERLFTAAVITPPSGVEQTAEDTTASRRHYTRTKELATLHATDLDAAGMANMYINKYSTTRTRIPSVTPQPNNSQAPAGSWDAVLSLEISNRIATSFKPMGDTTSVTREHFIEGTQESWSPAGCQVSFNVSPAELDSEYWVIGTGAIGDTSGANNMIIGW